MADLKQLVADLKQVIEEARLSGQRVYQAQLAEQTRDAPWHRRAEDERKYESLMEARRAALNTNHSDVVDSDGV